MLISLLGLAASMEQPQGSSTLIQPAPPQEGTPARLRSGAISAQDYPAAAIRAGDEGLVIVEVTVGPAGRVETCTIARSSGSAVLDLKTCNLVQRRFRYDPARTADGALRASLMRHRITWNMPSETEMAFVPGALTWTATAAAGAVQHCEVSREGNAFIHFDRLCDSNDARLIDAATVPISVAPVRVTNVLVLTPEGTAPIVPRGHLGLAMSITAQIEADASGRITKCEVIERSGNAPSYVRPLFANICDDLAQRRAAEFSPVYDDMQSVRRARLHQLVYAEELGTSRSIQR